MRWKIEYITSDSCNILVDDSNISEADKDVVGLGFPPKLAERVVRLHNADIEALEHTPSGTKTE